MMKENYEKCAVECVKDSVLPNLKNAFETCGKDLDTFFENFNNDKNYFAKVIESGKTYEMGYPACVCSKVASGEYLSSEHCECSRQSILFIMKELLPNRNINVEIIDTVLGGSDQCRFRVSVK